MTRTENNNNNNKKSHPSNEDNMAVMSVVARILYSGYELLSLSYLLSA